MTALVLTALAPVVLLIAFGSVLRRWVIAANFWSGAERLCYWVLLPALFFHGLATVQIGALPIGPLALVLIGSTVAVAVITVALAPLLPVDGDAFTSIFQGSIRFNNYIGVTISAGLFGAEGVAFAAVCNGLIVPMVNVLCVLVFARFGTARMSLSTTLKQIASNPLILSCVGGILVHLLGVGLPPGVGPTLQALGSASMPLGLLCVGAALRAGALRSYTGQIALSSTMKFIALPGATFLLALPVGLSSRALTVALLFQALPTASSSYMLARQLGGDAPLMAGITAAQTVIGAVAVPAVLLLAAPI